MENAIQANDIETIKYLLEQGTDPNTKTETNTPLIFLTENLEVLNLLLDNGADPNSVDENGFMLKDYRDDDATLSLLNKSRNTIIKPPSKFLKYNETLKLKIKRSKTLRAKKKIKVPQSD